MKPTKKNKGKRSVEIGRGKRKIKKTNFSREHPSHDKGQQAQGDHHSKGGRKVRKKEIQKKGNSFSPLMGSPLEKEEVKRKKEKKREMGNGEWGMTSDKMPFKAAISDRLWICLYSGNS